MVTFGLDGYVVVGYLWLPLVTFFKSPSRKLSMEKTFEKSNQRQPKVTSSLRTPNKQS